MDGAAYFVAADEGLWVRGPGSTHRRIDPQTGEVVGTVTIPVVGDAELPVTVVAFGSTWVSDFDAGLVYRHDIQTGERLASIRVGAGADAMLAAEGSLWVSNHFGGSVSRIDPATNEIVATIELGPPGRGGPAGLISAQGRISVAVPLPGSVESIDPATNTVAGSVEVGTNPCEVEFLAGRYWVLPCEGAQPSQVEVFDPGHDEAVPVELPGRLAPGLARGDRIWSFGPETEGGEARTLLALDPVTLRATDAVTLGEGIKDVRESDGAVWLVVTDALVRVDRDAFEGH